MTRPRNETNRHLFHVFSTFGVGGPQARLLSLANALRGQYRHTVLAMDGNLEAAAGFDRGVEWASVAMPVVKSSGISFANLRNARRLLRRYRPDLLLTYNWGAIEWALANWAFPLCRHVHVEDGFGPDEAGGVLNRRRAVTRRVLLSHCERVVVPSYTLAAIAREQWRLPESRVLYIPNGIDCARFARPPDPALLATLGIAAAAPVIGTVAGLRREKNLPRLVRIFACLPRALGARLVIIGEGPERGAVLGEAARLGVAEQVVLAGAMANPERLLGRFDVFALTSDTEQMPNSILEAMASGRAILATDVGDVRRIVAAENAPFVLPPGDEAALGDALARLLHDPGLRDRLGQANREQVTTNFSLESMVARYDATFRGTA